MTMHNQSPTSVLHGLDLSEFKRGMADHEAGRTDGANESYLLGHGFAADRAKALAEAEASKRALDADRRQRMKASMSGEDFARYEAFVAARR